MNGSRIGTGDWLDPFKNRRFGADMMEAVEKRLKVVEKSIPKWMEPSRSGYRSSFGACARRWDLVRKPGPIYSPTGSPKSR